MSGKLIRAFSPPGVIQKTHTHPSHTATAQQMLVLSQPSITDKTSSTDKRTDDHSKSWGSLRRPGEAAPKREGTPTPAPAPASALAAQVVQCGPLPRVYPPSFALEHSERPKVRHTYSTAVKLRVIEYTRLRCPHGGDVRKRGGAAGLGQALSHWS